MQCTEAQEFADLIAEYEARWKKQPQISQISQIF